MKRIAGIAFVFALLTAPAFAATTVSVTAVTGDAKIGREGSWKALTAGAQITENDFLTVPADGSVTVKLPDGKESTIPGKAIIPGRRLIFTKASTSTMLKVSKSIQAATEAVVGKEAKHVTGGAVPADNKADNSKIGKKGGPMWAGDDIGAKSSEADFAESSLKSADQGQARIRSRAILDNPNASALEKRRAHLILGQVATGEAAYETALKELDQAATKPAAGEGAAAVDYASSALVQRGQVHMQLGNDARAVADFNAAIATSTMPDSATAAQAHFFLGTIAASASEFGEADKHFRNLSKYPELASAGKEILAAVKQQP